MGSWVKSTKYLRNYTNTLQSVSETEAEGILPKSFYKPSIIPIPNQTKTLKENYIPGYLGASVI